LNKQNIMEVFKKEVKALGRDRIRLFFLIAFPIMLMVIFMVVFGGTGFTKYNVAVVNLDDDAKAADSWSARLVGNLTASELLNIKKYDTNETALEDLKQGRLSGIIIIPENYSAACASFWSGPQSQWVNTTLTLYVDSGSTFAKQALEPILQKTLMDAIFGQSATNMPSHPVVLTPASQVQGKVQVDARQGMVSGYLVYSVSLSLMTFAQSGVDDREKGVFKRYQMSQATSGDLLVGQTLGAMVTSVTQVVLIVLTGIALGFNPVGGVGGLAAATLVACLISLFFIGLGLIIGALVKTEGAATGASLSIVMIMAFFSGLFVPSEIMPETLQSVARIFPTYYANDAVKSLVARGASLLAPQVLLDIGIIATFSIIVYFLGWLVFQKVYRGK